MNEKIKKLQSLKADKAELHSLRELVVQAEASIYKSGGHRRAGGRATDGSGGGGLGGGGDLSGPITDEAVLDHLDEIYNMLSNKVDRSELELWLEDLQRNKKGRRVTLNVGKTKPKSQFGGNIAVGNPLAPIPEERDGQGGKIGVTNLAGVLPDDGGM